MVFYFTKLSAYCIGVKIMHGLSTNYQVKYSGLKSLHPAVAFPLLCVCWAVLVKTLETVFF